MTERIVTGPAIKPLTVKMMVAPPPFKWWKPSTWNREWREIGKATTFTANEAAEGMEALAGIMSRDVTLTGTGTIDDNT